MILNSEKDSNKTISLFYFFNKTTQNNHCEFYSSLKSLKKSFLEADLNLTKGN